MRPCPVCDGTGAIYLQYREKYPQDYSEEERWLPCGKCDGAGELPQKTILYGCGELLLEFLSYGALF